MKIETENESQKGDSEQKYKDTLNLPQTDFPMRGNGPVREPELQKRWNEQKIYESLIALRQNQKKECQSNDYFVLHDGPPYLSSDKIHIGTALNKILKDIIIKYKAQRGYVTPYVPGYDSHGLPIENAVVQSIKGGRNAVSASELRDKCKNFALANLKGQEEKFKRLGVLGDWEHPYITLAPEYEAEQIRLFGEMAARGYIYRGLKTVYWSYGCETALADAEVEYNEEHVSDSIYVTFKVKPDSVEKINFESFAKNKSCDPQKIKELLKDSSVVIWTTTPWTIPGNLAICLNPDVEYVIAESTLVPNSLTGSNIMTGFSQEDEIKRRKRFGKLILAKGLINQVKEACDFEFHILAENFKGKDLDGLVTKHPLFDRESPIIFGQHVTTETGTGCVHTAPGHGHEDFEAGKKYALDILCPVDGKGVFTGEAGSYVLKNSLDDIKIKSENKRFAAGDKVNLEGIHVIKDGNEFIIFLLQDAGALIKRKKITHSYPYCWRSKTPLLYRATEQWFASIDGFREKALSEIDKVQWIPERGRNRIYSMVQERGDWCISRQRVWGVPIPAFYDRTRLDVNGNYSSILDLEIVEHVARIFEKEGSSAWYEKPIEELIPKHLQNKYNPANLVKETDTMDVWFDSGSSHRAVLAKRPELNPNAVFSDFRQADMYLEGSDQHRGWFQSSLLTSVATNGIAPYKSVLTHGFVIDEKGRKMSKSLGNVVDPEDVIKQYGADILRLWVASVDYSIDIKVGTAMFKQLSDIYRNFRNTSRYMLGNLFDFDPAKDLVAYDDLWDLDRLILHRLQKLIEEVTGYFEQYQFFKYYQLLQNFCAVDLSAFYFDVIKDRLYTHGRKSISRRGAQTVLLELLSVIDRIFVPVLPHLAEDIYSFIPPQIKSYERNSTDFYDSILVSNWPQVKPQYLKNDLAKTWDGILNIRELANKEIEILRKDKLIGKSLEAQVYIKASKDIVETLRQRENEVKAVFIISHMVLEEDDSAKDIQVKASKFAGVKCERCWKYFFENSVRDGICSDCLEAITQG